MRGCWAHDQDEFLRDDAGTPLGGHGLSSGAPLRYDGESHRQAWQRICRVDPCAYCGCRWAGTLDHVEAQRGSQLRRDAPRRPVRGLGGAHSWLNYTGACERCNGLKGARPMLLWLATRRLGDAQHGARNGDPKRGVEDRERHGDSVAHGRGDRHVGACL